MLDPQVVVDLLPELRVRVDLMWRNHWVGKGLASGAGWFVQIALSASAFHSETNEFHKLLSAFS